MREVGGSAAESFKRSGVAYGILGACLIGFVIFGVLPIKDGPKQPSHPTQSAVQEPLWHKIPADCRVEGAPIAYECLEGLSEAQRTAMTCPHEDGNPDGMPCFWVDPDTRDLYWVSSAEYRN